MHYRTLYLNGRLSKESLPSQSPLPRQNPQGIQSIPQGSAGLRPQPRLAGQETTGVLSVEQVGARAGGEKIGGVLPPTQRLSGMQQYT